MKAVLIVVGAIGVIVSFIAHWLRHETSLRKRLFQFPWIASVILTILGAVFLRLPLWAVFLTLIFLPWILYLCLCAIFRKKISHVREFRKQEQERRRAQERANKTENRENIEIWARKLYQLADASFNDLSVGESEARQIGREINSAGGFQLMQRVAYRVRAMGKERGDWRAFAVQAVERWWDGIGGWRA